MKLGYGDSIINDRSKNTKTQIQAIPFSFESTADHKPNTASTDHK